MIVEELIYIQKHYNLENAEDDSVYGDINNLPSILTILDYETGSIMIKFRIDPTKASLENESIDKFSDFIKKGIMNFEIISNYAWLTMYDLYNQTEKNVIQTIDAVSNKLHTSNLTLNSGCAICSTKENTSVYYGNNAVNRLCESCYEAKDDERMEKDKELNASNPLLVITVPVLLLISTALWATLWICYDLLFMMLRTNTITLPHEVIIIILGLFALIGGLSSFPLAWAIRKSGITKIISNTVASTLITITAILLGEYCYFIYIMIQDTGQVVFAPPTSVFRFLIMNYGSFLLLNKAVLVIAGIIGMTIFSKRKTASIDL